MHKLLTFCVAFLLFLCSSSSGQAVPTAKVTFTTIDVPGAAVTVIQGINTVGDMVGYYAQTSTSNTHAFLLHQGTFTYFDYPGADSTRAVHINDSGIIVGYALKGTAEIGFTYNDLSFTPIRVPGKTATVALGINSKGD